MRWLAPLALIVAALTLALQFTSSPIGQLPRVHYQLFATGSGEGTSHVIRLDTDTGEMVAFVIGPRGLFDLAQRRLAEYGRIEFIELARLPEGGQR